MARRPVEKQQGSVVSMLGWDPLRESVCTHVSLPLLCAGLNQLKFQYLFTLCVKMFNLQRNQSSWLWFVGVNSVGKTVFLKRVTGLHDLLEDILQDRRLKIHCTASLLQEVAGTLDFVVLSSDLRVERLKSYRSEVKDLRSECSCPQSIWRPDFHGQIKESHESHTTGIVVIERMNTLHNPGSVITKGRHHKHLDLLSCKAWIKHLSVCHYRRQTSHNFWSVVMKGTHPTPLGLSWRKSNIDHSFVCRIPMDRSTNEMFYPGKALFFELLRLQGRGERKRRIPSGSRWLIQGQRWTKAVAYVDDQGKISCLEVKFFYWKQWVLTKGSIWAEALRLFCCDIEEIS